MAEMVPGRNGGRIKRREKGDPPEVGAGRPPGSKSFKTLLEEAMSRTMIGEDGKAIEIKDASAIEIVGMLISPKIDAATKLKAFQIIRDTIGEAPATKSEVSGPNGTAVQIDMDTTGLNLEEKQKLLDLLRRTTKA